MHEKSYEYNRVLSDEALEKRIGHYIKKVRQQQNKTQEEIAKAANISRSTLSLFERGESGNLKTLIQILRVLDKLSILDVFKFQEVMSPLALAKAQHHSRERVRKPKQDKRATANKKPSW